MNNFVTDWSVYFSSNPNIFGDSETDIKGRESENAKYICVCKKRLLVDNSSAYF